ncbi:MAG: hypothetical protein LBV47_04155 [Bacteroidales bacterium]|jgi:hypothetical protein|nr:hypothetical protein [Bacteroidales bacterium]
MKKTVISIIVVLSTITAFAQAQTNAISIVSPDSAIVYKYRLYPTESSWNFIKLNTRNGQMWQVQWDTKDRNQSEAPISLTARVSTEEEVNGRFIIYPTEYMYYFVLLDQIDGRVWQVQWGTKGKDMMVVPIE